MAGECSEDLICSDCHTIHYSQDGGVPAEWGKEGPYGTLLKNVVNELCLMCHDGFDPNAPNVMGENRYMPSAGSFASSDPNSRHSLGSQDKPPGYEGDWNEGPLTCVSCHIPPCNLAHANKYYRMLRTDPGGSKDITVTYETGPVYGGEAAIQQLLDTPIKEKYKVLNIKHRQSESSPNFGLSVWCAGCHTNFYGSGGDVNIGGSTSGDIPGSNPDTWIRPWIRHPTKGITLSRGVDNAHIDGYAENGLGYWWSSKIQSRPPYISTSGQIGSKSSSDNETGCISCHKAHGSDHMYCLIFDDPETSDLEDGERMAGTCQVCHLRGGGYYEISPHGDQESGLLRIAGRAKGECLQCHSLHDGKHYYNLFGENTNNLCYTSGCHDFTPTGGTSGYPAQERDRAPELSGYPGYFEYFSGGKRAVGLGNRVRWPGMDVFEDANTYENGPPERFFSPHRNDPDMTLRDSAGNGLCLNCHSPHGTENPFDMLKDRYLNTGGARETREPANYKLCFGCHGPDGPGGMDHETRRIADYYDESINPNTAGHRIRKSSGSATHWPSYIKEGDKLACSNCHNPHGSRGYENNNKPNARLLSDQRPGWNDLTDTIGNAAQCRKFCFGCHVPSDDPVCASYPSGCPEVDGIRMAPLPELTINPNDHRSAGSRSCYGSDTSVCHGNDYSSSTSYNVHHPNPSPDEGMGRFRAGSPVLSAPTGLIANACKDLVELAWDKYPSEDIRGYNLYRTQDPGGPYKLIASQPDNVIRYIDKDVKPGQNYYYVLTVEDIKGKESPYSIEKGATPMSLTRGQLETLEEIKGLSYKIEGDRIIISWEESNDELVAGYNIYRRTEGEKAYSVLINPEAPLKWPVYEDKDVEKGQIYIYSVVAVESEGNEARFPKELRVVYKDLFISNVLLNQEEKPLRTGQEMIVTLIGSSGGSAYFTIEGVSEHIHMEEIGDTGTYTGRYKIPGGMDYAQVDVTCFLVDLKGNTTSMVSPVPLKIDNMPPLPPKDLKASITDDKGIGLYWKIPADVKDIATYRIYRSPDAGVTLGPERMIASGLSKGVSDYKDRETLPATTYYYVIASVDEAGNESGPSSEVEVTTPPDTTPPVIVGMQIPADTGVWRTGETITILMAGEPGGEARFSIGSHIKDILMQESPDPGKYKGQYVFQDGDAADDMQITGKLTDPSGNSSTFDPHMKVSVVHGAPVDIGPQIYGIEENSFRIGGEDGLVAGDDLEVYVRGTPGCFGFFHLGAFVDEDQSLKIDWTGFNESEWRDITGYQIHRVTGPPADIDKDTILARLGVGERQYRLSDPEVPDEGTNIYLAFSDHDGHPHVILSPKWHIPLVETEEKGVYRGRYVVKPGDKMARGHIFATLKDRSGRPSVPYQSLRTITIDTGSRIKVQPKPSQIKAESHSRSMIRISLKDAEDNSVPGRQVGVAIFTTSEYTGLVGLGRINQSDLGQVVNALMLSGTGMDNVEPYIFTTDHYGEIEVDYQAGFAAKTVIFRARDLITGDVGIGYCTSYIETRAKIKQVEQEQEDPLRKRASGQKCTVTLSVYPKWLTADGISHSTVTATVVDELGEPLKGHQVEFNFSEDNGHVSQQHEITNVNGVAQVTYRAGKRIGTVNILASVTGYNDCSAEEDIILKSDAPAQVTLTVWEMKCRNMPYNEENDKRCKKLKIDADGKSECLLKIKVTDINGNPSRGEGLALSIINGDGKIRWISKEITDFNGEAEAIYKSGYAPGIIVEFNLRVTSRIPDSEELEEIRWIR